MALASTIDERLQQFTQHEETDSATYRPQFYRLREADDRRKVEQLLTERRINEVHDQLTDQLEALIKTRHPNDRLTASELKHRVVEHLDGATPAEYGVWVYYPWSRRLVHLVEQEEFIKLRTSRNCYKITPQEQTLLSEKKVGVVGLSVGQSVALTMTMERSFGEIRLTDFDDLEITNLNRLRGGLHQLGQSKAVLAAREIAEIDPFLTVRCFCEGLAEENLDRFLLEGGKLSVLIEECDGLDMKFLCRRRARELRIPVVMDTSDRGMLDVERFDLEPTRELFHGLVDEQSPAELKNLSTEDKAPIVLSILGIENLSPRLRASMLEIEQSIPTWPQLATSVILGGGVAADVCRRILLDEFHDSGRYFVDLDQLIQDRSPSSGQDGAKAVAEKEATVSPESLPTSEMIELVDMANANLPQGEAQLDDEQVKRLVHAATLAPSGGNAQPWKWMFRDRRLYLFHDRQRSDSLLDFQCRASHLALGAAAENLVLEAHRIGLDVATCRFPTPDDPRLTAAFTFYSHGAAASSPMPLEPHTCDELAPFVPMRLTNRQLGVREPIDPSVLVAMRDAAQTVDGAELLFIEAGDELRELAEIIAAADRLCILHPLWHRDFVREVRWTTQEAHQTRDGIDLATVDLNEVERAGFQLARDPQVVELLRQWNGGSGLQSMARKTVGAASAIGLLRMDRGIANCFFQGGRAMQRVWLEATRLGIGFHPLSAIIFLLAKWSHETHVSEFQNAWPEMSQQLRILRKRFQAVFPPSSVDRAVLLFRLSLAGPPKVRSLRRPVDQVLTVTT